MHTLGQLTAVKIIMYHYVKNPATTPYKRFNFLPTMTFKQQVNHLQKNSNFISINDIILCVDEGRPLLPNATLLTFDDGYADHYEEVYPVLKENNIKGCFYPSGTCIEQGILLDVNKIHLILSQSPSPDAVLTSVKKYWQMDPPDVSFEDLWHKYAIMNRFDPPQIIFLKRLLQHALPDPWRQPMLNNLFTEYVSKDQKNFAKSFYLQPVQIEEMIENGQHFGSHGYNHTWLDRLPLDHQREELTNSLAFLKSMGSEGPLSICYPYGGYNKTTLELAAQLGFRIGLTINPGMADLSADNALTLPRIDAAELYLHERL